MYFLWLSAGLDPIQKLFLDSIRAYSTKSGYMVFYYHTLLFVFYEYFAALMLWLILNYN